MRKLALIAAIAIPVLCIISLLIVPSLRERLVWHIDEALLRLKYTLNPPAKAVFVPQEQSSPTPQVTLLTSATHSASPTGTATPVGPTATPAPSLTPTSPQTPLPEKVDLKGVRYEDQHGRLNYCAPANLAMALSFWGWPGNRDILGPVIKPDERDKNVMPYEMVSYVEENTNLRLVSRVGADPDLLKRFLAAGYPVLVEKGTYLRDLTGVVSWMGHYQVLTGYDEQGGYFIAQDSYVKPDHQVSYADLIEGWRAFNYAYLVVYPPEDEAAVMGLLGPDADEITNYQNAALKASNEIYSLTGIDQYFAWFNRGSSLVKLQDYAGAAVAYDESFAVYPAVPETERPWRMLWYQTGPYFAYFYSGRYYDVLYLADGTLGAMQGERNLEESYYWRAMAKAALGDTDGAIQDFRKSLEFHPDFEPAIYQLSLLGVTNP